jgi:hypothetical protein
LPAPVHAVAAVNIVLAGAAVEAITAVTAGDRVIVGAAVNVSLPAPPSIVVSASVAEEPVVASAV